MQQVRRIIFILCTILYSFVNWSMYYHVHNHSDEHRTHANEHTHHHHTEEDNCAICFHQHIPQALASFDFVQLPSIHFFEIDNLFTPYSYLTVACNSFLSTNKDPPVVIVI